MVIQKYLWRLEKQIQNIARFFGVKVEEASKPRCIRPYALSVRVC